MTVCFISDSHGLFLRDTNLTWCVDLAMVIEYNDVNPLLERLRTECPQRGPFDVGRIGIQTQENTK